MEEEPQTWQELLGKLIAHPQTRARLAEALHLRPITLQRWADGTSWPRNENVRMLLKHFPREHYPLFLRLLAADFPELLREELPDESSFQGIPSEFYARAMSNLALTPPFLYTQTMQDLILQQALQHLDPNQQGLSIRLAVCVPPRAGRKVRSLREIDGLGTPPWPRRTARGALFLGAESLVGYAITHAHACVINSREEVTFYPVNWSEHEHSVAAFPILRRSKAVGGLIVSSAQAYFFTPALLAVIESYTHLATCIFEAEQSFVSNEIELWVMPPEEQQRPHFEGYNQRVSRKFIEADAKGQYITLQQAHMLVWQDLEDILLEGGTQANVEIPHEQKDEKR